MRLPGFRNGVSGCYVSRAVVHSILPLAVLEAVRNLDTPVEDGLSEFAEELLVKRLGLSSTVAMQLERYEGLVRRDARVEADQLEALLRLVGRRPDAELVFADAGRRAAPPAARRLFPIRRLLAHIGPRAFGYGAARGAARPGFGADPNARGGVPVAVPPDPLTIRATPAAAPRGLPTAAP